MLNILLLCNKPKTGNDANTIVDHIEALEKYSQHRIWLYSNMGDFSPKMDLNQFDVIIIHYSLSLIYSHFISDKAKNQLRAFKGLKVVFIQDEYRQINKVISQLHYLNIDVLFTCFPEEEMDKIYTKKDLPNLSLYNNLTGYVPQRLLEVPHLPLSSQRPLHLGYRGRKIPFWLGELAFEKWDIVEKWKRFVNNKAIKVDMSYNEKDRIYGGKWQEFILSCKGTLGVESGASVMDFTGDLEKMINFHQLIHPKDPFPKVQELFLKEHENKYKLNQISPRCFEAVALKTVLVLYEGEYSGILTPWRHYIPLKKDYSNIDEVLAKLLDDAYLQQMADVAFNEIALNPEYSYKTFIQKVDAVIIDELRLRKKRKRKSSYTLEDFELAVNHIPLKKRMYSKLLALYYVLPPSAKLLAKTVVHLKRLFESIGLTIYSGFKAIKLLVKAIVFPKKSFMSMGLFVYSRLPRTFQVYIKSVVRPK